MRLSNVQNKKKENKDGIDRLTSLLDKILNGRFRSIEDKNAIAAKKQQWKKYLTKDEIKDFDEKEKPLIERKNVLENEKNELIHKKNLVANQNNDESKKQLVQLDIEIVAKQKELDEAIGNLLFDIEFAKDDLCIERDRIEHETQINKEHKEACKRQEERRKQYEIKEDIANVLAKRVEDHPIYDPKIENNLKQVEPKKEQEKPILPKMDLPERNEGIEPDKKEEAKKIVEEKPQVGLSHLHKLLNWFKKLWFVKLLKRCFNTVIA